MRKIAVSLSKGGVAKITTAVNLAAHLAQETRVLLIDSDTQAQCSKMLDVQPEARLAELLEGQISPRASFILDTSPGWDALSVNVLSYAEEILCPVSLEAMSVDGFLGFLKSVEPIQKYKQVPINYVC